MADGAWSQSGCRPDVWWYGVPGAGTHYWTQRYGQYWVSGGVYQKYASQGYECGLLGPPVKPYGWISEMNYGAGCYGQWFLNGAIGFHNGVWNIMYGNYGQTAGRLADEVKSTPSSSSETPHDPPTQVDAPKPPKHAR